MDPKLKEAACSGDIKFLRRAVASQPPDYFLTQYIGDDIDVRNGNIFHLAVMHNRLEFMRVALKTLPITIQQKQILLTQGAIYNLINPLHLAACVSLEMVQLILDVYKSPHLSDPCIPKPWLQIGKYNYTPLHVALINDMEESAMEIMSMDMELLCTILDDQGSSPLFLAVKKGCNKVAEKILMSSFSYSLSGEFGSTPLHFAPNSSEKVLQLLLEKHSTLLMDAVDLLYNENMLHKWVELDEVWPFNVLLEGDFPGARSKVFGDLIYKFARYNDTPLHVAARNENSEVGLLIIDGYIKVRGDSFVDDDREHPWRLKNTCGDTPLHLALEYKANEELALRIISLDSTVCQLRNNEGISPLLAAVEHGCVDVVEHILSTTNLHFTMLQARSGYTVLHKLSNVTESLGRKLIGEYWWMIDFTDQNGRTALDIAKAAGIPWLINLLSKMRYISFDWIQNCEKDEIHAFIDNCKDLPKICKDLNDTPLHHIKLQTYEDYSSFLNKPSIAEIWNYTNLDGETPLHRAIDREDGMLLAKALLVHDEVRRNVEDNKQRTAMSMLANLSNENHEWKKMCKEIRINPSLKTKYIHPGTNLDHMRSTISVVAALLATIAFAAGFTLPGGFNQDNGNAIMAKKAAFLAFLLADAYALCTSILVLFCLIWSMVPDRDMTYLLLDRSVSILMHALYGTLVAFMTGIFAVVHHNSLWAGIVIISMFSIIGIAVNKNVLHYVVSNLFPRNTRGKRYRPQTFDEEKALVSKEDKPQTTKESSSNPLGKSVTFAMKNDIILKEQQGEPEQVQLLEEENPFTSTEDESGIVEGTNSKLLQNNSTPFVSKKDIALAEETQDVDNQVRFQVEGNTSIKFGEHESEFEETLSRGVLKNKPFLKEKHLIYDGNQGNKDPYALHQEGDYEQKMVGYIEEITDKYLNEIQFESIDEQRKKLTSEKSSNVFTPLFFMEQSQRQMFEQFVKFERQRVEFERQRVEWERQRLELEKERQQKDKDKEVERVEWERHRLQLEKERHQKDKDKEEETRKLAEVLVEIKRILK